MRCASLFQLGLAFAQRFFDLLSLGDVFYEAIMPRPISFFIIGFDHHNQLPKTSIVFAYSQDFRLGPSSLQHAFVGSHNFFDVLGMNGGLPISIQQLLRLVSEHVGVGRVN